MIRKAPSTRVKLLSLLVMGFMILLPVGPAAGAGDPDCSGCGWSECVPEDFCEDQTACMNLSGECAECAYTVLCGWHQDCDPGDVMQYCDVERDT